MREKIKDWAVTSSVTKRGTDTKAELCFKRIWNIWLWIKENALTNTKERSLAIILCNIPMNTSSSKCLIFISSFQCGALKEHVLFPNVMQQMLTSNESYSTKYGKVGVENTKIKKTSLFHSCAFSFARGNAFVHAMTV